MAWWSTSLPIPWPTHHIVISKFWIFFHLCLCCKHCNSMLPLQQWPPEWQMICSSHWHQYDNQPHNCILLQWKFSSFLPQSKIWHCHHWHWCCGMIQYTHTGHLTPMLQSFFVFCLYTLQQLADTNPPHAIANHGPCTKFFFIFCFRSKEDTMAWCTTLPRPMPQHESAISSSNDMQCHLQQCTTPPPTTCNATSNNM